VAAGVFVPLILVILFAHLCSGGLGSPLHFQIIGRVGNCLPRIGTELVLSQSWRMLA
jgi:hypothetical protein